jgi:hypothetical protein
MAGSRTRPDALLRPDPKAAERVLRMLREGKVRSVEGRDVRCAAKRLRARRRPAQLSSRANYAHGWSMTA